MPVIIDLSRPSGPSPNGWSYVSSLLDGCNMRWWLERKVGASTVSRSEMSLKVGQVLHALLDMHESKSSYQDYILRPETDWALQGAKVFARYRSYYAPGHWGQVIERERLLNGTVAGLPYSGRQDGIVKITKEACGHWRDLGVPVSTGKKYRLDYKSFKGQFSDYHYLTSPQFTGYWLLESRGLDGTLVLGVSTEETKRAPAVGLLIPPPTPDDIAILEHCVRLAHEYSKPPYIPNPGRCGFGSWRCPFHMKECDLHSIEKGELRGN